MTKTDEKLKELIEKDEQEETMRCDLRTLERW